VSPASRYRSRKNAACSPMPCPACRRSFWRTGGDRPEPTGLTAQPRRVG
jgi:hypothetical protein